MYINKSKKEKTDFIAGLLKKCIFVKVKNESFSTCCRKCYLHTGREGNKNNFFCKVGICAGGYYIKKPNT